MPRLADDEIALTLGNERVRLRPTLRAALRLERRHGGFDTLMKALADGSVSAMADVLEESSSASSTLLDFLRTAGPETSWARLNALAEPLMAHVLQLAGVDPDAKTDGTPHPIEAVTFAEHHTRLFQVATGALGWSPETAWNASPAEIIEAYRGRIAFVRAVFGGSEENKPEGPDNTRDEAAWAMLKASAAAGGNRAA